MIVKVPRKQLVIKPNDSDRLDGSGMCYRITEFSNEDPLISQCFMPNEDVYVTGILIYFFFIFEKLQVVEHCQF